MNNAVRILGWSWVLVFVGAAGCFPDRPEGEASAPDPESAQVELALERAAAPMPRPLVEVEIPPEPEPEPPAFAGRETVRVEELLAALSDEVPRVAAAEAVVADYQVFLERFKLEHSEELLLDYARVKIAFEATRDGGWWGVHWKITNEQPNSDKIWAAWQTIDPQAIPQVTAVAECDELSALFAFVVHRIGLSRNSQVGLLWPVWNHVVAVWTINPKSDNPVRVIVPTSQIFLTYDDSLGTDGFNPWKQKTIYDYRRKDADPSLTIPGPLASAFVQGVRDFGHLSQTELQAARNQRQERQAWSLAESFSEP